LLRLPGCRYDGVAAKTDSGWSMKRAEEKFGAINSRLYRRQENFKKIKVDPRFLPSVPSDNRPNGVPAF
jgi:hypothetical protein